WARIASSAIASATLDPASSAACRLPFTHTAGRIRSGSGPIVSSQTSRPSGVLAREDSRTHVGYASAQARNCSVSCLSSRYAERKPRESSATERAMGDAAYTGEDSEGVKRPQRTYD